VGAGRRQPTNGEVKKRNYARRPSAANRTLPFEHEIVRGFDYDEYEQQSNITLDGLKRRVYQSRVITDLGPGRIRIPASRDVE